MCHKVDYRSGNDSAYHENGTNMRLPTLLTLALALAMFAQQPPNPPRHPQTGDSEEDVRLPNGKLQKDEILKADFEKSLQDARELSKLADELKTDLEKNRRYRKAGQENSRPDEALLIC